MVECPISFEGLFQLVATVEGLSLWGIFNTLPNTAKRRKLVDFRRAWQKEAHHLTPSQQNELYRQYVKEAASIDARGLQIRICKFLPGAEIVLVLLLYVGCPAFLKRSALEVFACCWRPLCAAYLFFIVGRVIWFICLSMYFLQVPTWVKFKNKPKPKDFTLVRDAG